MSHDRDSYARDGDALVSAAYREMAIERAPAALDKSVLAQATVAANSGKPAQKFNAWFRPLAFIATATLSLAIILEISQTDDVPAPSVPAANETGGIAPRQDKAQVQPDTPGAAPQEDVDSVPKASVEPIANRAAEPLQTQETAAATDLESAAADASGRLKQVNMQTESLRSEDLPSSAVAAYSAAIDQGAGVRDDGRLCGIEATRNADAWWACIDQLRRQGNIDGANAEQTLMQAAFPDFAPPE